MQPPSMLSHSPQQNLAIQINFGSAQLTTLNPHPR
jgi:hypothetical protein